MSPELRARLAARLEAVGAASDARAIDALAGWFDLHGKWAKAFNLTGTRDGETLVDLHLADCAAIVPLLPPGRLLDVGSGAGLPGLIVALLEPAREMVLLDSAGKRTRFLEQAVLELGLANVKVVTARIEAWQPPCGEEPAAVLVRAVAPLARLAEWTGSLLDAGVPLLAMKGPAWREEADALPAGLHVTAVRDYALPGTEHRHVLVEIRRHAVAARL